MLDAIVDVVPGLVAGGADLTGNTGHASSTDAPVIATHEFGGRQIHWGVREHGMGAVMNGMAVSGTLPVGGTFFVFSDYMRAAPRLAALSRYKTAFVWSHDSVGVGEDGPTHQPIEQLASLRAMPGLRLIRPADANEVAQAWRVHIDGDGPTAIILTPPEGAGARGHRRARARGASPRARTSLVDETDGLDLVLIGTGSEVSLCVDARDRARGRRPVGAGRVDAVVGSLRGPARRVPRRGAAARGPDARGRGRRLVRLGPLRRRHRRRSTTSARRRRATVFAELGFTPEHVAARADCSRSIR